MANFKAWKEQTRAGNWLIRYRDGSRNPAGQLSKFTDGHVEKGQTMMIDGKVKKGEWLADALVDKLMERHYKGLLGICDSGELVLPLVEQFLDERENRNFSPRTVSHDRISLESYVHENNVVTLKHMTRESILFWLTKMRAKKYTDWTIDGRLSDLRTFCYWLVEQKKFTISPFGKNIMPKRKGSEPKFYTASEYMALDAALADIHPSTRLMCNLAHSGGLRKAEMVGHAGDPADSPRVMMEDITWTKEGAELLIRKELTKTNRSRTIPLDKGTLELIGSRRSGTIIPFTRYAVDHYFQRAKAKAGINKDLTIHGLRHTFAKNYLQRGQGNLASLKELMGHASIVSTMIYSQFEKSYLREGVERAYERRLVEENLAGQNGLPIELAGQKYGV